MSIEDNKQLVRKFWKAFSESRMSDAHDLLHADLKWQVMGKTVVSGEYDKAGFVALSSGVVDGTEKGVEVTPLIMTAEEDRVSMTATSYGVLKNGRIYDNRYHFLHRVRDGLLLEVYEYLDTEHAQAVFGD